MNDVLFSFNARITQSLGAENILNFNIYTLEKQKLGSGNGFSRKKYLPYNLNPVSGLFKIEKNKKWKEKFVNKNYKVISVDSESVFLTFHKLYTLCIGIYMIIRDWMIKEAMLRIWSSSIKLSILSRTSILYSSNVLIKQFFEKSEVRLISVTFYARNQS